MLSYAPPKRGEAFVFETALTSQATGTTFKSSPTLAAGDVKVRVDGGTLSNITTLPTASGKIVTDSLSAAEMTGDNISVIFSDAAGSEWCDQHIAIQTEFSPIVRNGTCSGGTSTTVTLDGGAPTTLDLYQNHSIYIYDGTGAGQSNLIEGYSTARVATVRTTWAVTPDVTSKYAIFPAGIDLSLLDAAISSRMPSAGGISVTTFNADPLTLLIGFDHNYRNGNSVRYTNSLGTWPDLSNATVRLYLQGQGADGIAGGGSIVVGTVEVPVGVDQAIHFDVPHSVTSIQVPVVNKRLYASATLANGDVYPLVQGSLRWRDPMDPD